MLKLKHLIAAVGLVFAMPLAAQEPVNLDELLQQLKDGKFAQTQDNQAREARFQAQAAEQEQILREAIAQRDRLEQLSAELESQFETNERDLAALEDALTQRMGSLKELFGVLQQVAGDTASTLQNSYVSVEFPGRSDALSD